MTTHTLTKNKKIIKIGREPMVIFPLKKWTELEIKLEDLEMYRSESFAQEIEQRRKEKKNIPLAKVLKKYHI